MSRVRRLPHAAVGSVGPAPEPPPLAGALAGYRLLRRIASGERADVYLATVDAADAHSDHDAADAVPSAASPTTLVAMRVYPAHVPDDTVAVEIEAMSADTSGTLPALFDVAGFDDGRCCLAVERLPGPSVARLLTERSLSAGEGVTILAPIVVGVAELAAHGFVHTRLSAADLLLDEAGRPRLIGLGSLRRLPGSEQAAERTALHRAGHVALTALIEEVGAAVQPAGALDPAVELMRRRSADRPFLRCEAELERLLFQVAVPEPIGGVPTRPRATRVPARIAVPVPSKATDGWHGREPVPKPVPEPPDRRVGGLSRLLGLAQLPEELDERLAGSMPAAAASLRDRFGAGLRTRRGALTVGGLVGAGALVLLLTLVPPAPADGGSPGHVATVTAGAAGDGLGEGAAADTEAPVETPGEPPAELAGVGAGAGESADEDPIVASRWLLERRAECFAELDLGCLAEVLQPGSAIEAEDRATLLAARDGATAPHVALDASEAVVTVEMGDAVLIAISRAGPEREPASLLVVRGEAGWRLREIFD